MGARERDGSYLRRWYRLRRRDKKVKRHHFLIRKTIARIKARLC